MPIRFLIDENAWREALIEGLKRIDPSIDAVHIGDQGVLPNRTPDPVILRYCELEQRILITRDVTTMPGFARDHLQAGHHHWGIFYLRRHRTIGEYLDVLNLIWGASEPDEWIDREEYIP
jgi:hypothetical protein